MLSSPEVIIGIDLGTTNTVFAHLFPTGSGRWEFGRMSNKEGSELTPSVVHFEPSGKYIVGKRALDKWVEGTDRTVRWIKRRMGTDTRIQVSTPTETKTFSPQDISAFILLAIKEYMEDRLEGARISKAVVTVPAYFGDNERQATLDAAAIAGIDAELVEEPSAAVLDYVYEKQARGQLAKELDNGTKFYSIFDLGGGTFDISLAELRMLGGQPDVDIVAKDGDKRLGGYDFDVALVKFALMKAAKGYPEAVGVFTALLDALAVFEDRLVPPVGYEGALADLLDRATFVKEQLCEYEQYDFKIVPDADGVIPGRYVIPITQAELNDVLEPFCGRIEESCNRALLEARAVTKGRITSWADISRVILIGGSTRLLRIKDLVTSIFGQKPSHGGEMDLAVARGAAIRAAIKGGHEVIKDFHVRTSHNYGILVDGALKEIIVERGSRYPVKRMKPYRVPFVLTPEIPLVIGQEYYDTKGRSRYEVIKQITFHHPFMYSEDVLDVTFSIDQNGILNVRAQDVNSEEAIEDSIQSIKYVEAEIQMRSTTAHGLLGGL